MAYCSGDIGFSRVRATRFLDVKSKWKDVEIICKGSIEILFVLKHLSFIGLIFVAFITGLDHVGSCSSN